jgi:carbon monoxide dehydrogenase subunit G
MPEVGYATVVDASLERVWTYVENLNNWSHLMVGFQSLDIVTDRQSVWTLRGDVGILSREVKVQVDITEWLPLDRVDFTVVGITERLDGAGSFVMRRSSDTEAPAGAGAGSSGAAVAVPADRPSLLRRLRFALVRRILKRLGRKSAGRAASPAHSTATTTGRSNVTTVLPPSTGADEQSRLEFQLRVSPGGPMAPMLELLMAPMLEPAAQDLADGIRKAVEA